jgi:hypothetical protein
MIRLLFDENTHGLLPGMVLQFCLRSGGGTPDVLRIGDSGAPPYGTSDPAILAWAASTGRTLVTRDYQTMPGFFADLTAGGNASPGILILRQNATMAEVAEALALMVWAGQPEDCADRIRWIPD